MYEFLEEDDDFEEFENDDLDNYDKLINQGGADVEMQGANPKDQGEADYDRQLW